MDFPSGNLNKPQARDVIKRVFPRYKSLLISVGILLIYLCKRYDADCLLKNVFEIFENPLGGGRVSPNEILWIFSMAMNGTGKRMSSSVINMIIILIMQPRRNYSGCSSCTTRT